MHHGSEGSPQNSQSEDSKYLNLSNGVLIDGSGRLVAPEVKQNGLVILADQRRRVGRILSHIVIALCAHW